MTTSLAINGLGRIGRCLLRIAHLRDDLDVVAINDPTPIEQLAGLVARDSVHGRFPAPVAAEGNVLRVGQRIIPVSHQPETRSIEWPSAARMVVEASGKATTRARAEGHLRRGVRKVLVSALADADFTVCFGLNHEEYDPNHHHLVSNASCTTQCLGLLVAVLDHRFGIRHGLMNEVHSYTSDQRLVDGPHPDPRRARAAAINIVPTTSRAPTAVTRLLPHLEGRLTGGAIRVPTPDVALLELVATLERPADTEAINRAFRQAAAGELEGLLSVSNEPLVSSDHVGDSHSAIVDTLLTRSLGTGELVRVSAWYDNEWGYAHRLADLASWIGDRLS